MESTRGLEHSGGPLHVRMVKEATKFAIDRFDTLQRFLAQYEPYLRVGCTFHEDHWDKVLRVKDVVFRPDLIIMHTPVEDRKARTPHERSQHFKEKVWERIENSSNIVFEVETDPMRFFRENHMKLEFYKRLKNEERYGRHLYAFVLVVAEGASVPASTEPFDEVWRIPKSALGVG